MEIGEKLQEQADRARLTYSQANAFHKEVIGDIPSGLPQPDGSLRIRQANLEYRTALQAYRDAIQRLTDFMLKGIVPDDLKR